MRKIVLRSLVTLAIAGCGDDSSDPTPDAPPEPTPPRVIEGGGIGDGPIDGVANVYVIDDATRDPISGATVRVGDVEGTTGADGLFIAEGVTGAQTVVVKATDFRAEMWVGANGANMTFSLTPDADANPRSATMTGSLSAAALPDLAPGHVYFAQVGYSQTDDIGADENELATPNDMHQCLIVDTATPCTFTVTTRTGRVALFASVLDVDTQGTQTTTDDLITRAGYAFRAGVDVTAGATMSGMDLDAIGGTSLNDVTIDFGTPPSALSQRAALVSIEAGADGLLVLGFTPADEPVLRAPKLSALPGATAYRLITLASNGADPPTESINVRRGLASTALAAGTWLSPPGSTMVSRTGASWAPVEGATVHSVEFTQGIANLLNVTVFDDTTLFTIPELVALPQGPITARVQAIGAPGLDVTDFSLDEDADKLAQVAGQTIELP